MKQRYPRYAGYNHRLKGPSSKPCVVCGDPGFVYATIEVSYFRGDDIEILLCLAQDCRTSVRLDPAKYLPRSPEAA